MTLVALCDKKAVALRNNRPSHFVIKRAVINLKWIDGGQVKPLISIIIDNNNNNNNCLLLLSGELHG